MRSQLLASLGLVLGAALASAQSPPATRGSVGRDSVKVEVTNGMPHPMLLFYRVDTTLVPLTMVGPGEEKTVTIRGLTGDSVTVWAKNENPPHDLSKTFPIRSTERLKWEF